MKEIFHFLSLLFCISSLNAQKLSPIVKADFCQNAQKHLLSRERNDDFYQVVIFKAIRAEFSPKTIDEETTIAASICKQEKYFNAIVLTTYKTYGSQYLFAHLYSFLGMNRDNAIAMKNYIVSKGLSKTGVLNKDSTYSKLISLRQILETSKWYFIGVFNRINGVGDQYEKDKKYVTQFNAKSKTFEMCSSEFGYKGTYTFNEKDSILTFQVNYEMNEQYEKANKKLRFKISYDNAKMTLSQIGTIEFGECCFDYEFLKADE